MHQISDRQQKQSRINIIFRNTDVMAKAGELAFIAAGRPLSFLNDKE
ncbi:MAG: hypothetical protein KH230_04995 [Enterocloster asparagiformis]|nr:hypothetical protein [Enterocloster asparagiformis]